MKFFVVIKKLFKRMPKFLYREKNTILWTFTLLSMCYIGVYSGVELIQGRTHHPFIAVSLFGVAATWVTLFIYVNVIMDDWGTWDDL